jgi:O-methyltransferase
MNEILQKCSSIAYSFKETVQHTYDCAEKLILENIEGDFVECGVAAGAQIGAMQCAIKQNNVNRRIFAFDSFEGIPMAGEFDTEQAGIGEITHDKFAPIEQRLVSSGVTVHSLENVLDNFKFFNLPTENIIFVKGWFQHTLHTVGGEMEKIALLRLDGDLYESTFVCLEYLYPKVVKGGIVIIDDYALNGCRQAIKDYFPKMPKMIEVEGGGGVAYFVKK